MITYEQLDVPHPLPFEKPGPVSLRTDGVVVRGYRAPDATCRIHLKGHGWIGAIELAFLLYGDQYEVGYLYKLFDRGLLAESALLLPRRKRYYRVASADAWQGLFAAVVEQRINKKGA